MEAGTVARIGYQLGTLLAPVAAIPWVRFLAGQRIGLLPSGPTKQELRDDKQVVLLEIEDPLRTKIIDWRWETPAPTSSPRKSSLRSQEKRSRAQPWDG